MVNRCDVDLGLAKTNMASGDFRYIKRLAEPFKTSNSALLHLENDIDSLKALDYLLQRTRDTWIVLYYNGKDNFYINFNELFDLWGKLANQLRNIANVAFVNLSPILQTTYSTSLSCIGSCPVINMNMNMSSHDSTTVIIDEIHTYQKLPIIKLHRGDQVDKVFQTDIKGVGFPNLDYEDTASILRYVMGTFEVDDLAEGSIMSMSVDIRRRHHDAMVNLQ